MPATQGTVGTFTILLPRKNPQPMTCPPEAPRAHSDVRQLVQAETQPLQNEPLFPSVTEEKN
jgi:hypothetical protein